MRNAIRTATAVLAATLCIGAAACGTASQTATASASASTQTQGTTARTPTPTQSQQPATPSASSAAAAQAADYTQEELQTTVDQLEATPKALFGVIVNDTPTSSVKDDTRLMQAYFETERQYMWQNDPYEDALGVNGTWARTSYDASTGTGESLNDIEDENLSGFILARVLKRIEAPDGTGTTRTDGQWAHAEWTGYRAIWKTDGNRYTLYIIMA